MKYPIKHLSFSSIVDYLNDSKLFEKRWIRFEFETMKPYAMIFGAAFHRGIEIMWREIRESQKTGEVIEKDSLLEKAEVSAWEEFTKDEQHIDYGKTQDKEKAKEDLIKLLINYYDIIINPRNEEFVIEGVELASVCSVLNPETKEAFELPLKVKIDRLERRDGKLVAIDTKTASTLTDHTSGTPAKYELQAACLYFAIKHAFKEEIEYVEFEEITKHKTCQHQTYLVKITKSLLMKFAIIFGSIMNDIIVKFGENYDSSNPFKQAFLPNPFAMFGGDESWADFCKMIEEKQSYNHIDL